MNATIHNEDCIPGVAKRLESDSIDLCVWASVAASRYGQHDASWLVLYDFFREVCGLEIQTEKLAGLTELAKHAGWWLPHQHICWVSVRG